MAKIKPLPRAAEGLGKLLRTVWNAVIVILSLGCLFCVAAGEAVLDACMILLLGMLFATPTLLLPARSLESAQKALSGSRKQSGKSYIFTAGLSVFLGFLGAHRFYTGHLLSGLLYLMSFGGFGIGWLVDIYLTVTGRFTDADGRLVRPRTKAAGSTFPAPGRATTSPQPVEHTETDMKDTIFTNYASLVISGTEESRQAIPSRQDISRSTSVSVRRNAFALDAFQNDMAAYANWNYARFCTIHRISSPDVPPRHVQFIQYRPTYSIMNAQQKAWYFHWRDQVRGGSYPATDYPYILLHATELISGYGWTDPADGYRQFIALWGAYRKKYVVMDSFFRSWSFDFSQEYDLEYRTPEDAPFSLPAEKEQLNIILHKYKEDKPLKLPFELIGVLADYSFTESSFYQKEHQALMEEAIPRVVALADAALLKRKGLGILAAYGPKRAKSIQYFPYRGTFCEKSSDILDISLTAYCSATELRRFLNNLVRHAENVLRGLYGHRGRLRDIELDEETAALAESFLTREYNPKKKEKEPEKPKKQTVSLNFDSIAKLRKESDAVRNALEVPETIQEAASYEPSRTLLEPIPEPVRETAAAGEKTDRFDLSSLSDPFRGILETLSPVQAEALHLILTHPDPGFELDRIANAAMTMPEMLIDEINDIAMAQLGDLLIDTMGEEPRIYDYFESELKSALK